MRSKWLIIVCGLVLLIPIAYVVLGLAYLEIDSRRWSAEFDVEEAPFDAVEWRAGAKSSHGPRLAMVDDLLARHSFTGTAEASLIELLGAPSDGPWTRPEYVVYWLGPEPGPFGVDSVWLLFTMHEGIVTRSAVVRD